MKMVIVESPFASPTVEGRERNLRYAKAALLDSLERNEAAFASHLLYPLVLDDDNPDQRMHGINAGLEIAKRADLTAVYSDLGMSKGMLLGISAATRAGRPVEYRKLANWR